MLDRLTLEWGFDLSRYLGKWFELAWTNVLNGLVEVSATYPLQEEKGVKVVSRGINAETGEPKEAVVKAYFLEV